ncbi:MAG: hypothetical protein WHT63_02500, partial [Tepidiforma sp.]
MSVVTARMAGVLTSPVVALTPVGMSSARMGRRDSIGDASRADPGCGGKLLSARDAHRGHPQRPRRRNPHGHF